MDQAAFHGLLTRALQHKASDILLKVGQPPAFRIGKALHYLQGAKLADAHTEAAARLVLARVGRDKEIANMLQQDLSYAAEGLGRFRVNIYKQRGSWAMVMRVIPNKIPPLDALGVPPALKMFTELERGLVLVVGATGSGKSTTLASMISRINQQKRVHIVTIEDPIEYEHQDQLSTVSQREVGIDAPSFADALRAAMRQNPDVILLGEIRDAETMDIALKAAETGHLVFSTMHTPDVSRTVGRVLALAEGRNVNETRERFADNLRGIIAQRLIPKADGSGLVVAVELMVVTGTARDSLRKPDTAVPLKDIMEQGTHPYGMQTFRMHLEELVSQGLVSVEVAQRTLA